VSIAAIAAAAVALAAPGPAPRAATVATPDIGHVFTIVLENKDYEKTFGPDSQAPYLARTLAAKGALLTNYYGIGHASLDNYIAMISGQAPNPVTQSDCQLFTDFVGTAGGPDGQALGAGCVYPPAVETVADQLEAKKLAWKGYMEDMGDDATREAATCAHPAIGARDNTQGATAADQYATRHNPFVYFHSVIDDQAGCDARVVNLDALPGDLTKAGRTPAFSFITPDLCSDGHDSTCAAPEQKGGYEGIDGFLKQWVPQILKAPAFREDGLLIVTFDEAEDDSTACCDEPTGPNTPSPGAGGPGGGRVGAILIGPSVKPGTVSEAPINHYGYLRSIEDFFGLDHLGYAAQDGLETFASLGVLNRPAPRPVQRFKLSRERRRLIIKIRLAPGLSGKVVVRSKGLVRRFTTGARTTLRVEIGPHAKVTLRALRDGKTVAKVRRTH
jgi:phosphatidylinositol-3-phosphatase